MNGWSALAKLTQETGPEARKTPRFRANEILVEKGEVLDYSATGLRIRFFKHPRFRVGDSIELELMCPNGSKACRGTVVWLNPLGRKACEAGIRLDEGGSGPSLFRAAWDPLGDGQWSNR